MIVVVTGGRDYFNIPIIWKALDQIHAEYNFTTLVGGKAKGVDTIAHKWALHNGVISLREPADWATYGKRAGPVRNELMITKYKPEMLIAFPGGQGTSNMTKLALEYGLLVKTVRGRN